MKCYEQCMTVFAELHSETSDQLVQEYSVQLKKLAAADLDNTDAVTESGTEDGYDTGCDSDDTFVPRYKHELRGVKCAPPSATTENSNRQGRELTDAERHVLYMQVD
jgi:hypothetical protein